MGADSAVPLSLGRCLNVPDRDWKLAWQNLGLGPHHSFFQECSHRWVRQSLVVDPGDLSLAAEGAGRLGHLHPLPLWGTG